MDWGSLIGPATQLGGSIFGAGRTNNQSNQYFQMGQPYRDQLQNITNNPSAYYSSPEAQALANASDRRYSSVVGNPAGSGTAQAGALEAMRQGYGQERDRLFNYGGGAYFNRAAPGAYANATNAGMGVFNAFGPFLQQLLHGSGGNNASYDSSGNFTPTYTGGTPDMPDYG